MILSSAKKSVPFYIIANDCIHIPELPSLRSWYIKQLILVTYGLTCFCFMQAAIVNSQTLEEVARLEKVLAFLN